MKTDFNTHVFIDSISFYIISLAKNILQLFFSVFFCSGTFVVKIMMFKRYNSNMGVRTPRKVAFLVCSFVVYLLCKK